MSSDTSHLNIVVPELRTRDLDLYIQEIEDELPGTLDASVLIDVFMDMTRQEFTEMREALKTQDETEVGRVFISSILRQFSAKTVQQARQAQQDDQARDESIRAGEPI